MEFKGCFTAMVTPFKKTGKIDWERLEKLVEFQRKAGISGILFVGTTGESPTLNSEEHIEVIEEGIYSVGHGTETLVIGGTGSNNTTEALEFTEAVQNSVDAILLVDPYYNKPASPQIREFYYTSIAEKFPELPIIPYVIPGRTAGTGLLPEDLHKLKEQHPNIIGVKDAIGDNKRAIKTRKLLPEPFKILSGDDSATLSMMINPEIRANGVISVISNVFPGSIQKLTELIESKETERATELNYILTPLFDIVTVKTEKYFWPNPCGIKTLMAGMGMIDVSTRPPLGPMESDAVEKVREAIFETTIKRLNTLSPGTTDIVQKDIDLIKEIFQVDVRERIKDDNVWKELSFEY